MSAAPEQETQASQRLRRLISGSLLWIVAVLMVVGITAIFSFNFIRGAAIDVAAGEPVGEAIFAPFTHSFVSDVLTRQEQDQAANAVPSVYTSPDLSIGRAQRNLAQAMFNYMDVVRADPVATVEEKRRAMLAIQTASVSPEIINDILNFSDSDFTVVKDDVLRIIELTMRDEIRETNVSEARRVAQRQISFFLTAGQERVVINIAPKFVVANSFFDAETTERNREAARAAIVPVRVTVTEGQQIVRDGEIVTEAQLETLETLGLLQPDLDWRQIASILSAVILGATLVLLYWQQYAPKLNMNPSRLLLFCVFILLFAVGAKLMVPGRSSATYLFPSAAIAMLLAVLYDSRLSLIIMVVGGVLVGYIATDSLELATYTIMGGALAVLALRDAQRVNVFFRAGSFAALANVVVIVIFRLPLETQSLETLRILGLALANGFLSAGITLAGLYFADAFFGVTTTVIRLQDLSRMDHPLLQELLRKAPGTYHHSIMVANLAEQAAEVVRANPSLVRVGAFYHDIGKMNRPPFFTENFEGNNPHETLDPYSSARIIISHVTDGMQMARQYKLPEVIRDFIAQHHGTGRVQAFYAKAVEAAGGDESEVDEARFRYPGPRPQSREAGIVLLADSIEATSSALRPGSEAAIVKLVNRIVDGYIQEGQLNDSQLTMGDIQAIRGSYIKTLKGRFHVRVRYPGNEELELQGERESPPVMVERELPVVGSKSGEPAALESR